MYTAEELVWATQLAYCDFTSEQLKKNNFVSVLFQKEGYDIYYSYSKKTEEDAAGDEYTMIQATKQFIDDVIAAGTDENKKTCKGWKIVDVFDDESNSGLYAIMIETGENEAIIAFRGSESYLHGILSQEQVSKDWVQADGQILYGMRTLQESKACEYLDHIANTSDFDKYQNIALTGHSLGGNLALVATIYTATDACETNMASRIVQSVMPHYHWSWVGSILKSVCQKEYEKYETRTSAEICLATDILGEDRQPYGMAKAG